MRACKNVLAMSAGFVLAGTIGVSTASAVVIPLVNAGFETADVPTSDIVGWDEVDFAGDPFRTGTFTTPAAPWGGFSVANPEGARVAYLDATSRISQNSLHALVAGEVYTLSAWFGNRLDGAQRPTDLSIFADNGSGGLGAELVTVEIDDEEIPNGTFGQRTIVFDTTDIGNAALVAANLGRNLHVYIAHSQDEVGGGEVDIDDVQFSYTPVPEPAALSLLGIGAIAAVSRRRR